MGRTCCAVVLAVLLTAASGGPARAGFPTDDIQTLDRQEIADLTDDKLVDHYIDVLVEMEAAKTFHSTSGFTPKEYTKYKELLKYRLLLLFEIHRRKLELPPSID